MIDPNFNPYDLIQDLQKQIVKCLNNQARITEQSAQQHQLNSQLIEQINQQTEIINRHDLVIHDLHNRLQLIEIARQYDTTKT